MSQLNLLRHRIQVWEVTSKQLRLDSNRTRMSHASWRPLRHLTPPGQYWITSVVFGCHKLHEFAVQNHALLLEALQLPLIYDCARLWTHCFWCLSCCKPTILHSCQAILEILGLREKLWDCLLALPPVSLGSKRFRFGAINRHALGHSISLDDFCRISWLNLISRIPVEMIEIIRHWLAISSLYNWRFQ